ncbi:glutamate racemase [Patescibacteria group bacterium]
MIGIFDSGVGGLTVLKPIMELLPKYDYVYLGDNSRAPYGNKNKEAIINFSEQAINYLFDQGVVLIIFACNTASSVALRPLQKKYLSGKDETDRKILGVLRPVVEKAAQGKHDKIIGIVGTKATVNSKSYEKEITHLDPKIKIVSKACPLLVPFIEEGWHNKPEAISILKKYLRQLKSFHINELILGCTHYPFMHKHFQRIMGNKVEILESGEITAKSLQDYLERHPEIESKLIKNKKRTFLTTGDPDEFQKFIQKYIGTRIKKPLQIDLE